MQTSTVADVWNVRAVICRALILAAGATFLAAPLYAPAVQKSIFRARGRMKNKQIAVSMLVLLLSLALIAAAQKPDAAAQVIEGIESRSQAYTDVALQIWRFAETGFQEVKSSALLAAKLAEAGFSVQKGVAEIPTAFMASYGRGKPVIAFIGECDALPGLSQEAVAEKKPVSAGAPGHGCGHNLLGTASMAAAIAVKDWLAASRREGSIRFYGTPAEEGGAGKVYMVRAGLSIGMKGMLLAAKTMALTGVELLTDPAHIQKARAEFDRRRGDVVYKAVIGDRKPPLDYRKKE
jgi:hypothetical protein